MFQFASPQYLYLLAVPVVLALLRLFIGRAQRKRLRRFGDPELVARLTPMVSRWRPWLKFWLLDAALALLVVMLARPQFGKSISEGKHDGIEAVIAFDVSNSMRAVDEGSQQSRLDKAKMLFSGLIDKMGDNRVGLVVFAGDAFVQLPLTNDHVSAKMFLNSIDPAMVRYQGTDIAQAIEQSTLCFSAREHVGKAMIIITDGEDHEGAAIEAAKKAHEEQGRNVYVLGIGSTKGAPVPDVDDQGRRLGYMTDNSGQQVMSALNEQMCKELAQAGGGAYIHVNNISTAQKQLEESLDKLEKAESTFYSDFDEQFQAVGILVLLLLVAEVCILEGRNPRFMRSKKDKR